MPVKVRDRQTNANRPGIIVATTATVNKTSMKINFSLQKHNNSKSAIRT
jgi:hypothetical protein